MTPATGKTKVLYIGGYSRSGSTLLLRLLGEQPGFAAVGELFDVWERSYIQNQLCGCGLGFRECDFWIQVTAEAFGCKPDEVPAGRLNQTRSRIQGHSRIPALWLPRFRSPRYRRELSDYAALLEQMYASVRNVTDSEVVVDSSKVPQYAWVLAEAEGIELHMVHLVRDSRATAFSWQRQRVRPEITTSRTYMDRHSVVRSASEWNAFNYLLRSRRNAYASYTLIKYEDLVADPSGELQRVIDALGGGIVSVSQGNDEQVSLKPSHTAAGNPGRFETGEVRISLDSEWIQAMPGASRQIVTALTAPSLARYHYPLLLRRAARTGTLAESRQALFSMRQSR
jgi:hypothetical protein